MILTFFVASRRRENAKVMPSFPVEWQLNIANKLRHDGEKLLKKSAIFNNKTNMGSIKRSE
jgi:hypothetical protein